MGTVTNPLGGLLNGLVTGYTMAHRIKNQAMQEEAHQRNMAMQDREMQVQDIQHRMMLDQNARPVNSGTVADQLPAAPEVAGQPTMQGGNPQIPILRPVDKSRKVTYKSRDGQSQDYELLTPEEQIQRQAKQQAQGASTVEDFKTDADVRRSQKFRNATLNMEGGGTPAPAGLESVGVAPGTILTRQELTNAREQANKIRSGDELKVGEGDRIISRETGKTIATGGEKEDPKTRAARSYYAEIIGKDPKDLNAQELAKGVQEWETATMNPLDKQLKEADLKAKPFDLAAKQSTIASQSLERQIKHQEIELAGDADTINMAAQKYLQTGQMPALGMGSSLLRAKIMGRAGDLAKENGLSPEQVPALQDSYKAMSKSLSDLQTRKGQLEAFEQGGAKNLDNFIRLAQKQIDTGSPLANRAVRGAARTLTGSADQAAADAARMAAYNEISKILSGSLGNSGVSDSARHEAEGLLSGDYTMKQLLSVSKVLRQDMKNRVGAYGDQIGQIRQSMQGLTKPGTAAATAGGGSMYARDKEGNLHEAPAGTPLPAGWTEEKR